MPFQYVASADNTNASEKAVPGLPSLSDFDSLSYYKADHRFTNMVPYSAALITKGSEALKNDNKSDAIMYFQEAIDLSPHLPESYLYMAKASLSIRYIIDAWAALTDNIWWSFKTAGMLLASISLALFASSVIFVALLALSRFSIYLHDIIEDRKKIYLLIPSVILAFGGPIYGIFAFMLPFWGYLKKKEKAVMYGIFLITAAVIFALPSLSTYLNAFSDATLRSIINVNSGFYTGNAAHFREGDGDYESVFSYALYKKQKGSFNEAIMTYESLLGKGNDAKIYNNIANCYVGLGEYRNAVLFYDKSVKSQELASAYYNLSQLKNELFEFKEADAFYKKSLEVNEEAVALFATIKGHSAKSSVVDEVIDGDKLRALAFQRLKDRAITNRTGNIFTFIPSFFAILIFGIIVAVATIYDKKSASRAFRCEKCGNILCGKCEEEKIVEDGICPSCFKTLSRTTGLNPKERMAKMIEINRYKDLRNTRLKIMTLFLPGSGHIFSGNLISGFLILFLFMYFIASSFIWALLMPTVSMAKFSANVMWLSIAGAIISYLVMLIHVLRKAD